MAIPSLVGTDPGGKPKLIGLAHPDTRTFLFVFSQTCGICDDNWPNWVEIIMHSDRSRTRFLGVNLVQPLESSYAQNRFQGFTEVITVDRAIAREYRFGFTPQTILLNSDGTIERVWTGLLDRGLLREIDELFAN
ncbi:MAG: hypothetical protein L0Z50_33000 [Verrucomicrobiales bacterium]|nr:hypothetical protein [Verrucomicrobiales bacterium]